MDKSSFSSWMRYAHGARVEMHIGHASRLAKHAVQTIAGPLERTAVTRDAERHLGLNHLDGMLM